MADEQSDRDVPGPAPAELRVDWPLVGVGRTALVYASGPDEVCKVFHDWVPEDMAETEWRTASAVAGLGVGAPQCRQRLRLDGRWAIRYERVDGGLLGGRFVSKPLGLAAYARLMAGCQHRIGQASGNGLQTVAERLAWAIRHQTVLDSAEQSRVLAALAALPEGDRLCHGDLHPLNVMTGPAGTRVIDWMNAAQGPAEADVARSLLLLRFGRDESRRQSWQERMVTDLYLGLFARVYLAAWLRLVVTGRRQRRDCLGRIRSWMLPHAAARLAEGCGPVETRLVSAYVRKLLKQRGGNGNG